MGRREKYRFPLPGRKSSSRAKAQAEIQAMAGMSKAQRLLGAGGINIDSSTHSDTASWKSGDAESIGISISISDASGDGDAYDGDSVVDPMLSQQSGIYHKTASTVLGSRFAAEERSESVYSVDTRGQVHREESSSTLRSYYDKTKSPLLISQQTSASSARDMALRKGATPVLRSPLLQVDHPISPSESQFREASAPSIGRFNSDRSSRKKPLKLDLSKLFPKPSKESPNLFSSDHVVASPSALSVASTASRISNPTSRGQMNQQETAWRRQTKDSLSHLYDHYENMPNRRADGRFEDSIPEEAHMDFPMETKPSGLQQTLTPPDSQESRTTAQKIPEVIPIYKEHAPWNETQPDLQMATPPWETQSVASFSSHNTRNSRHTMNSIFSSSDLQQNSILSLSSDDESGDEVTTAPHTPNLSRNSQNTQSFRSSTSTLTLGRKDSVQSTSTVRSYTSAISSMHKRSDSGASNNSALSPEELLNGNRPSRAPWRTSKKHISNLLTIPEPTRINPRISGPWNSSGRDSESLGSRDSQSLSRKPSNATTTSSQVDSPPPSPSYVRDPKRLSGRSSRFMAVTRQEEALLEALRQKRAMMRDNILAEYGKDADSSKVENGIKPAKVENVQREIPTKKAEQTKPKITLNDRLNRLEIEKPLPPPPPRKHPQRAIDTAVRGRRGRPTHKEHSLSRDSGAEFSEFSPDLSDFLTHGSDDESTPRSSWITNSRESSATSLRPGGARRVAERQPLTPPSAARLSAVGAAGGFRSDLAHKRTPSVGVRFADDESSLHDRDLDRDPLEFLDDIMP